MSEVKVFGTDWCEDTQATRIHLDGLGIGYDYINIEQDPQAREWVKRQNHGKVITPTVDMSGEILVEPTAAELEESLCSKGMMA